ncbi:MAG: pyruvate ferredoxin oxidoreductase [Dehalococcoidales bacterium]|nr:pyruvate ferredoxin oxidoreductase [Dehalococcoidales bacterium]MDP6825240.1 pyruvate ferredoxin oxidoreductase [Dehalococcoidales bacterium]
MPPIEAETRVLEGNGAVAYGVTLCRPDVIAAFPITPATSVLENLYRFSAQGLLDAELVEVEGENSALSVVMGASAAGARTFTATSSMGLVFMFDAYLSASGSRLPIVMPLAMREQPQPLALAAGTSDALSVKDGGWIQIYVESCQEILDSIIMAYRLAEDSEILLPVNICYLGFYLSYLSQKVEIPSQEDVDAFLAPLNDMKRVTLNLEEPLTFPAEIAPGDRLFMEYRLKHSNALQRAKQKLDDIDRQFAAHFGRSYGGQIEEHRTEDAEIILVTMESTTGTARVVIDKKRDEGLKVGLIKIRMFRPFPRERLVEALRGKKAIGVIDRHVSFGWNAGHCFVELKTLMSDLERPVPLLSFIDGAAGADITVEHIERAIDLINDAADGKAGKETTWLALE